jgi:hypothetical protein
MVGCRSPKPRVGSRGDLTELVNSPTIEQMIGKRLRVLMFGHCYPVHTYPLANGLRRMIPGSEFDIAETVMSGFTAEKLELIANLNDREGISFQVATQDLGSFWRAKFTRFNWLVKSRDPLLSKILKSYYDLYHLHWPSSNSNWMLRLIPQNAPLVVSFWGHDILNGESLKEHVFQRMIVQRATIITVRSIELREHLYSKFGRSFKSKIRIAKFANKMFSELVEIDPAKSRHRFQRKHKLDENKVVLCIGHCADPKERHLEVMRAISILPSPLLAKLHVLLPLTYGGTPEYRNEIKRAGYLLGLNCVFVEEFLSRSDLWDMRFATDIIVSVPDEDSFSAAMCESILAGAVAIVGEWLPYGGLRRANVYHRTVEELISLTEEVQATMENLNSGKKLVQNTRMHLKTEVDIDSVLDGWISAYRDALNSEQYNLSANDTKQPIGNAYS